MNNESWIAEVLGQLREDHLERVLNPYTECGGRIHIGGREFLNFSCNDYLGLARNPALAKASADAAASFGAGATASRLVTGTLTLHETLEHRLAAFKGYPAALLFGSGFLTNTGVIPSLVGRDDAVFADRFVHASILDAIALSRARLSRFQHNDPASLDSALSKYPPSGRRLVVTESVFSMDGDLAPLPDLARVARKHGAMFMVDEAHATGVFGPAGSGLVREHKLEQTVNISMGTMSKAFGGYGGFVACTRDMRNLLVNRARSFIYSTALPPAVLGAAIAALDLMEQNPGWGAELLRRADGFRKALAGAGLNTMQSASQIVPVLVGDNQKALSLSRRLRENGILCVAIRPPTVPPDTARLRFSVSLAHTEKDLEFAATQIVAAARAEGLL